MLALVGHRCFLHALAAGLTSVISGRFPMEARAGLLLGGSTVSLRQVFCLSKVFTRFLRPTLFCIVRHPKFETAASFLYCAHQNATWPKHERNSQALET